VKGWAKRRKHPPIRDNYIKFGRELEAVESMSRLENFFARLAVLSSQWSGPPNPSADGGLKILQSPVRLPGSERRNRQPATGIIPLRNNLSRVKPLTRPNSAEFALDKLFLRW